MTLRLVFGLLGDTEEFCGSVLASKGSYVWLQLWNRNTHSREHNARTKDLLRQLYGKKNVYQVHKVNIRFQKLRKQNPELSDIRTLLKKNYSSKNEWDSTKGSEPTTPRSPISSARSSCTSAQDGVDDVIETFETTDEVEVQTDPVPPSTRELEKKVQDILDSMTTPSAQEEITLPDPAIVATLLAPVVDPIVSPINASVDPEEVGSGPPAEQEAVETSVVVPETPQTAKAKDEVLPPSKTQSSSKTSKKTNKVSNSKSSKTSKVKASGASALQSSMLGLDTFKVLLAVFFLIMALVLFQVNHS